MDDWFNHQEVGEPVNARNHGEFWNIIEVSFNVTERETVRHQAHIGMDVDHSPVEWTQCADNYEVPKHLYEEDPRD